MLLCIEVFRPDEMILVLSQKKNKKLLKAMGLKQNKKNRTEIETLKEKQKDNPFLNVTEDSLDNISSDSKEEAKSEGSGKKKKLGQGRLKQIIADKQAKLKMRASKNMTTQQKIEKQADENVSKPIVIKAFKNKDNVIRKINDDFGLNYLPGAATKAKGLIDENDMEKGFNQTMIQEQNMNDSMNIDKRNTISGPQENYLSRPTDMADDFGLGKIQFLDINEANDDV